MAVLQEQQGHRRPRRRFLADLEGIEDASVVDTATEDQSGTEVEETEAAATVVDPDPKMSPFVEPTEFTLLQTQEGHGVDWRTKLWAAGMYDSDTEQGNGIWPGEDHTSQPSSINLSRVDSVKSPSNLSFKSSNLDSDTDWEDFRLPAHLQLPKALTGPSADSLQAASSTTHPQQQGTECAVDPDPVLDTDSNPCAQNSVVGSIAATDVHAEDGTRNAPQCITTDGKYPAKSAPSHKLRPDILRQHRVQVSRATVNDRIQIFEAGGRKKGRNRHLLQTRAVSSLPETRPLQTKPKIAAVAQAPRANREEEAAPGSPEFVIHSIDLAASRPAPAAERPQDSDDDSTCPSTSGAAALAPPPVSPPTGPCPTEAVKTFASGGKAKEADDQFAAHKAPEEAVKTSASGGKAKQVDDQFAAHKAPEVPRRMPPQLKGVPPSPLTAFINVSKVSSPQKKSTSIPKSTRHLPLYQKEQLVGLKAAMEDFRILIFELGECLDTTDLEAVMPAFEQGIERQLKLL